jgi:hypothetical protein
VPGIVSSIVIVDASIDVSLIRALSWTVAGSASSGAPTDESETIVLVRLR